MYLYKQREDSLWSPSGICDAWDGRLFYQVLFLLLESESEGRELPLSESSKRKFESLVRVVSSLVDDDEGLEASHILQYLGKMRITWVIPHKVRSRSL